MNATDAESIAEDSGGGGGGWIDPRQSSAKLSLERLAGRRAVNLNKEIARHAKAKDLPSARKVFKSALALKVANNYTYTNMVRFRPRRISGPLSKRRCACGALSAQLNAHVRCGDARGAAKLLGRMRSAGFTPCVTAYTTVSLRCTAAPLSASVSAQARDIFPLSNMCENLEAGLLAGDQRLLCGE
eukprot:SAG11_NODE_11641_length_747_cov_1.040123_1_plen_186_part_00